MKLYRDHAVVLRTIKLGEADRIVTLVTEGRGRVRAVAKGVRKTKSRFGGRLEPMTHVAVQLYEGRELDTITQVETVDHFRTIRDDLDRVAKAQALLEVVDQVAQDHQANSALYPSPGPPALGPPHAQLRGATHQLGQDPPRSHPLPQTVHRTRDLPDDQPRTAVTPAPAA